MSYTDTDLDKLLIFIQENNELGQTEEISTIEGISEILGFEHNLCKELIKIGISGGYLDEASIGFRPHYPINRNTGGSLVIYPSPRVTFKGVVRIGILTEKTAYNDLLKIIELKINSEITPEEEKNNWKSIKEGLIRLGDVAVSAAVASYVTKFIG